MIKEKKSKIKSRKTIVQIIAEYARTVFVSFLIALVVTLILSFHARSEMIKNLYANAETRLKIDEEIAMKLVTQSDLSKDLKDKKYAICMQVGNIYASAHDYIQAQYAYELALEKAPAWTYLPYQKLVGVLIAQEKFDEANDILLSVTDVKNKNLINFKTRSYIEMGDKYYAIGKFLSAAKSYEKAMYYYDRFNKKDKKVEKSIKLRIVNAYVQTADIMAKNGYNSETVRFLEKAYKYEPNDFKIRYKLALVYADFDPIKSVEYFEPLLEKMPQYIDYNIYGQALMKAANIADLENQPTKAKYYRYKIHSIDIFINQKVIYKDDIKVLLKSFTLKKQFFKYKLRGEYSFQNVSSGDIKKLNADFILKQGDVVKETATIKLADKQNPLYSNGSETNNITVTFGKNIFTKKELEQYYIEIYLYKNDKFKTLVSSMQVPIKSVTEEREL